MFPQMDLPFQELIRDSRITSDVCMYVHVFIHRFSSFLDFSFGAKRNSLANVFVFLYLIFTS